MRLLSGHQQSVNDLCEVPSGSGFCGSTHSSTKTGFLDLSALDTIHTIDAIDTIGTIDTIDTIGAIDTIAALDTMDAIDTIDVQ